jgi:hypothetical protein
MAPPLAGQAGFLEPLESIGEEQFARAMRKLQQPPGAAASAAAPPASAAPAASSPAAPDGLLLKDATLEDIVRFLQSKNIEPTFRFLTR